MNINNPFRLGLLAGLGVLVALLIGNSIGSLATILTYIGAAIFLALGLDPFVTWLEKRGLKRPVAILVTIGAVLAVLAGLVVALIPVIVSQVSKVSTQISDDLLPAIQDASFLDQMKDNLSFIDPGMVDWAVTEAQKTISDRDFINNITNGLLQVGVGVASGVFGAIIVVILMIYFIASLSSLKRGLYKLVPASQRPSFIDLAEQISTSVGRYVMGQVSLALINGVLSFIFLSIIRVEFPALLAFIAFLGSLIPLVGTLSASIVIFLSTLLFTGADWRIVAVGIWYLVYMQVEAYVLNPRVMARAVQVPGVVVVIAALVGGTLLGVLGALIAIPVAAAVQLIMKEVVIPRQNAL